MDNKPKILLHICCAPCSTHVINTLKKDYNVTGFFYNPNIHPKREYIQRAKEMNKLLQKMDIRTIEGEYDLKEWYKATKGFENEPEGGKRCEICFRMRLKKTAELAKDKGFQSFTTTLTIGPQKNAKMINDIGIELSTFYNIEFLQADFKKKDGFKKSVELSKKYDLKRQEYCGCIFSKKLKKSTNSYQ